MIYLRTIVTTFLALLLYATATAQVFDNVSIDDASVVCSIAQDEQGILWFGSDNGLYSYDGYRTIPHNTNTDGTSINPRIHCIYFINNKLYMATERGLMLYDVKTGRYTAQPERAKGDTRAVTCYGGRLWFGGAQGLLSCNLQLDDIRVESKTLHNVYSLLATKHGLLVGTISGLTLLRHGKPNLPIRIGDGEQPLVNALLSDGSAAWIGTEGALYRYDGQQLKAIPALAGNSIKSLATYGDLIYAGTDNGLYTYNKLSGATLHALHDSRSPRTIANNIVWTVYTDRWGNLWAGTDQGVSDIRRQRFFNYIPLSYITQTGDGNCLHLIYRSADGRLWLGGSNGLISYNATRGFMPDNTADVAWYRQNSLTHHMSHNRVRRVYSDRDGTVIICTDHGLNIYNPATRQMRNIIVTDRSRRYSTAWAYDIVDDGKGRYWISSYMGGVFVVDKHKLLSAPTPAIIADRHYLKELQGIHVSQLVADGRGYVWVRMYNSGLDRINLRTMKVEHIVGKDNKINNICADRKGNLWVAMQGEVRCFGANGKTQSYNIEGYNDNAMLCEVEGYIWVLMGQDCCILNPDGSSTCFSISGFRPLAIWYDRPSRHVLLGGNDAIVAVPIANVHNIGAKDKRATFLLSALMVDGKPYTPDGGAATYLSEITLTARQNNLSFLLSDLPMSGKQPRMYAYRLEGADRGWQYMHGERQEISYSALPSGKYTLEVREVDGLGKAQGMVYQLQVTILPPWYLSIWAKALYLLAVVALIVWAVNFYMIRRRLREEREAKKRVMKESAARSAFFDNLSRQLKQPLGTLFGSVLGMLHDEKDSSRVRRLEQMRRDVVEMNTLVYKALDMQTIVHSSDKPAMATIDIADFCRRAADDARIRYGKKLDIDYRTDAPTAYVSIDVVGMQPMLDELIAFAADNRKADAPITISVSSAEDKTSVSVGIPGMKIAKGDMPFVFNRYYSATGSKQQAGGNTLALIHEFAEHNGGVATIETGDNDTTVGMTFESAHTASAHNPNALSSAAAAKTHDVDSIDARLLAKITQAVEEHVADSDFNVTRLQETLGLGSKLLYRKVKQMTGKTPVEFIRQIRMQRAAILLRESRFSVSEVMYMVGFSNSSYFSKCFQKAYGITPTAWSTGTRK